MKERILHLIFLSILVFASEVAAQIPGSWEGTVVCSSCPPAVALDFADTGRGVIVLRSRRAGFDDLITTIFSTSDNGSTWAPHYERLTGAGFEAGDEVFFRDGYLIGNSLNGMTLRSIDYGDSIEVFFKDQAWRELDFFAQDLASLFVARTGPEGENILEVAVSRDSGKSYVKTSMLELSKQESFVSARFRDTAEIWAIVVNNPAAGDLPKVRRLLFTLDQGVNWSEVFPLDTNGTKGNNTSFGQGSTMPFEGLTLGAEPGSAYLIYNFYKSGTPERRLMDLLFTSDYGKTWIGDSAHVINKSPFINVELVRNPSKDKLWLLLGNKETLAYSPDNAKSWHHDSVTFKGNKIAKMLWEDSITGYVLTYSADSTLIFWKYVSPPSIVAHSDDNYTKYFYLRSTAIGNGKLNVKALQPLSGRMEIFDILGRIVWTAYVQAARSEHFELSVPSNRGVYFLMYSGDLSRSSARFVHE